MDAVTEKGSTKVNQPPVVILDRDGQIKYTNIPTEKSKLFRAEESEAAEAKETNKAVMRKFIADTLIRNTADFQNKLVVEAGEGCILSQERVKKDGEEYFVVIDESGFYLLSVKFKDAKRIEIIEKSIESRREGNKKAVTLKRDNIKGVAWFVITFNDVLLGTTTESRSTLKEIEDANEGIALWDQLVNSRIEKQPAELESIRNDTERLQANTEVLVDYLSAQLGHEEVEKPRRFSKIKGLFERRKKKH